MTGIALITAVLSLFAAILAVWNNRKIKTVHTLVNQTHQDNTNRIDQLTSTIQDAGVQVPANGKGGKHDPPLDV